MLLFKGIYFINFRIFASERNTKKCESYAKRFSFLAWNPTLNPPYYMVNENLFCWYLISFSNKWLYPYFEKVPYFSLWHDPFWNISWFETFSQIQINVINFWFEIQEINKKVVYFVCYKSYFCFELRILLHKTRIAKMVVLIRDIMENRKPSIFLKNFLF